MEYNYLISKLVLINSDLDFIYGASKNDICLISVSVMALILLVVFVSHTFP